MNLVYLLGWFEDQSFGMIIKELQLSSAAKSDIYANIYFAPEALSVQLETLHSV